MYFIYGSKDVIAQECKNLHERLELELDGKKIELPQLEGIIVLNISSWCGGCEIWKSFPEGKAPNVRFVNFNEYVFLLIYCLFMLLLEQPVVPASFGIRRAETECRAMYFNGHSL